MSDLSPEVPLPETLRAQLQQLNERSRWYTSQSWQVPFAYIGVTGVVLAGIWKDVNQESWVQSNSLFATAVLGVLVFWHLLGVQRNICRVITNIETIEGLLGLRRMSKNTFWWTTAPWFIMILLAVVASLIAGFSVRPKM